MPKKVITRRQRKAAEAKRLSESQSANGVPVRAGSATKSAGNQSAAIFQQPPRDRGGQAKNVKTAENKKSPSDTNSFDLAGDGNGQDDDTKNAMQKSQPPTNGQVSFSKTLTRRAVAAFTKIRKFSKRFNKKPNYKNEEPTEPDIIELTDAQFDETVKAVLTGPLANEILNNKSCSCETCTAILNRLWSYKKCIEENDHKEWEKLTMGSHMGTSSSGRINDLESLELPLEAKFEECNESKIKPSGRCIFRKLEMNEKLLKKVVIKKIKQLEEQSAMEETQQFIKKSLAKNKKKIEGNDQGAKETNQACLNSANVDSTTFTKPLIPQSLKRKSKGSRKSPRQTTKLDELKTAVKELGVDEVETSKPKVMGNTGYFILVGNDEQLSAQIDNLAARNVTVEDCVVLKPDVADKVEQQMEQINMNRDQILKGMGNKHNMMANTRRRRLKDA